MFILRAVFYAQDELEELEKRWDNIESRLHRLRDNINALRREREADPSPPQAPGLEVM